MVFSGDSGWIRKTLLRVCLTYQDSELWNLSLVDPEMKVD